MAWNGMGNICGRPGPSRTGRLFFRAAMAVASPKRGAEDLGGEPEGPTAASGIAIIAACSQMQSTPHVLGRAVQPLSGVARYRAVGNPVGAGSFGRVWIAVDTVAPLVVAHRMIQRADRGPGAGG